MDLDYKKSAQYKEWYAAIKADNPGLPEYLADLAISFHLKNPKAYREHRNVPLTPPAPPKHTTLDGAVGVYNPEDLPSLPEVPVVDK
jgi:hypothetical protein